MKRNSLIEEQVQAQMEARKRPVKREKQQKNLIAILGILLFLASVLAGMLMQLRWLWG